MQRLIGLLMMVICGAEIIHGWHYALTNAVYWPKVSVLMPVCAAIGLAMFLFPMSKEECFAKYGSEQLGWSHMRIELKVILVAGLIAGFANWAFIGSGFIFAVFN